MSIVPKSCAGLKCFGNVLKIVFKYYIVSDDTCKYPDYKGSKL